MAHQLVFFDDTNPNATDTIAGMRTDFDNYGINCSSNLNVSGIATFRGIIADANESVGFAGSVLSSTGAGVNWIAADEGNTASASNIGVNEDGTDAEQWLAFVGAKSGNNPIRADDDLRYNPSTNILSVKGITLPADDQKITLGEEGDLEIFCTPSTGSDGGSVFKHTGDHDMRFQVPSGAHDIVFEDTSGNNIAVYNADGACQLHWRGTTSPGLKLATSATGVTVTGAVSATSFSGSLTGNADTATKLAATKTIGGTAFDGSTDITPGVAGGLTGTPNIGVTNIDISGTLKDFTDAVGSSGQVLTSTTTGVEWKNAGSIAAGAAAKVSVNDESGSSSDET